MRIIKYIVVLFYVINLPSCNFDRRVYKQDFELFKSFVGDSLMDHFPEVTSMEDAIYYGTYPAPNSCDGICFFLILSNANTEILEVNELKDTITPEDTCVLIIPWHTCIFYDREEFDNLLQRFEKRCDEIQGTIPNFTPISRYIELDDRRFPKDFLLFRIEEVRGVFFENTHLSNGWGLPKGWEHGYSKGIAINYESKKVIYWTNVW